MNTNFTNNRPMTNRVDEALPNPTELYGGNKMNNEPVKTEAPVKTVAKTKPAYMTVADVADIMGCSLTTIRRMIIKAGEQNQITYIKFGSQIRITSENVDKLVALHTYGA